MTPTPWMTDAGCRGATALFFPPAHYEPIAAQSRRENQARAMCARCPVFEECATELRRNPKAYTDAIMAGRTPGDRNLRWINPTHTELEPAPALFDAIDNMYAPRRRALEGDDPRDVLVREYLAAHPHGLDVPAATMGQLNDEVARAYQLQLGA